MMKWGKKLEDKNMKQTLIDTHLFTPIPSSLNEGKTSDRGFTMVEGVLATAELENGNGRYYSKALWEREANKYAVLIKERRALGELDHPESSIINLKNVSHNINSLTWKGDNLVGTIEILPTPSGNILKALFDSNIKVGISSRGEGSLKEEAGLQKVQDDFELVGWDFVSTPSNANSWMNPLNEGKMSNGSNRYLKINNIITEILCSHGCCPVV